MPSVVHIVTTGSFAGVERYVCNTATELAGRDWDVTVVGGDAATMSGSLGSSVQWLPGATAGEALRSLAKLGRRDICHVHMTIAEAVGVAARPLHRAPVVSTRHFAARRGSTPLGRALAPLISAGLAREIAVSQFVARSIEGRPDAVIVNGVLPSPCLWQPSSRIVLVLSRLDPEKDTLTALSAWQDSQLWKEGWAMRVVGDGSQRPMLKRWVRSRDLQEVVFTGWVSDVSSEFARAGVLLAPAHSEPCGLAVLEAMAAGVPVIACAGGGHMETVGLLAEVPTFPPGDAEEAAAALRSSLSDELRCTVSASGRHLAATRFSVAAHVDRLVEEYSAARGPARVASLRRNRRTAGPGGGHPNGELRELVVCSLEPWDDVWRRNQFFTDVLLRRNPELRVLFVEPSTDPLFDIRQGRTPVFPRLRSITEDRRLRALRPLKVLPRRAGPIADWALRAQVRLAARASGFRSPALWVNDATYAPLMGTTAWPSVYDVTDDWLLAPFGSQELTRLRHLDELALRNADEVVVCSAGLARTRGARRRVSVIPNGVDREHFRRPRARPADLPSRPVAVYVGALHEARLDVDLVLDLAKALPAANVVLVGPDSLAASARRSLAATPNIRLLGPRPYELVPAYLQHADVVIVPHRLSPFTESLDPIKAYECLVVDTPTVATAVAGFRDYVELLDVVERENFVARVERHLLAPSRRATQFRPPNWEERAAEFEAILFTAAARRRKRRGGRAEEALRLESRGVQIGSGWKP